MPKNVQTIVQLCSFHMLIRLCSKSFKFGFSSMWRRTSICTSCVRKGRGTRDQIADIHWITEKARKFHKNTYFCFIDYAKAFGCFDCVDNNKQWKILQEMGISEHLTCLLRNRKKVKKQLLEPDMEQQTGSKLGKEYIKAIYCHPAYLTYMQTTSCEMPG